MGSYENIVKIEEMKRKVEDGDLETAQKILDTMEIKKIKNVLDINLMAEVYEANGKYEEAKELYLKVYEKTRSRKSLFNLINIVIKLNDVDDAQFYYEQYERIAPDDFYIYIFRYYIEKMKGQTFETLISILEDLKKCDYIEKWAYELAKLYYKAGMEEECIRECSDIILWFGEGTYVEKAKILRSYYLGETDKEGIMQEIRRRAETIGSQDENAATNTEVAYNTMGDVSGEEDIRLYQTQEYTHDNPDNFEYTLRADVENFMEDSGDYVRDPNENYYEDGSEYNYEYSAENNYGYSSENNNEYSTESNYGYSTESNNEYSAESNYGYSSENNNEYSAESNYGHSSENNNEYGTEDNYGYSSENNNEYSTESNFKYRSEDNSEHSPEDNYGYSSENYEYSAENNHEYNAENNYEYNYGINERYVTENEQYDQIGNGQNEFDILSWIQEEYGFSAYDVFGDFLHDEEIGSQLLESMQRILREDNNIMMLITGSSSPETTTLAKSVAIFLNNIGKLQTSKLAKISAEKLNKIDIFTKKDLIKDCCLVIDNSQVLSRKTIDSVIKLSAQLPSELAVVFAANEKHINKLFKTYPNLANLLENRIHL